MKILFFILAPVFIFLHATAQVVETNITEQQLENSTENNEDLETEDDSYLQQMQHYLKNPVDLNQVNASELKVLRVLTPIQIQNFILYRDLLGKLIDIYELQAIPSWDQGTIQKIRPYITVSLQVAISSTLNNRLKKGEHQILIRASQVLERSKGYLQDPSTATNFYPGSPQKILFRYTYAFKNLLQFGIVGEKDAGEQFFKGKQKQGFDFYSVHLFVRKIGIIKSLAIGDFTVNLGQGLVQWQSLAFKKGPDVIHIKREAPVLLPYHSAGETNFHRGIAITMGKRYWQLTGFVSYRKIDANLSADSSQSQEDYVSSLQTSGYHRTKTETDDKGIQGQFAFGGNLSYQFKRISLGINAIRYRFKLPLIKSPDPYNRYALGGDHFGNYSLDYSYTYKNIHLFGEAAFTSNFDKAFLNGIIFSASALVDVSMSYRNISRSYQSLYTSAFTENTYPSNEKGFYAGISVRPGSSWQIDAYADLYKFPWLRYRVDAPSAGADYLIQAVYKPNKKLEIYTRFHSGSRSINQNPDHLTMPAIAVQPKKSWRTQISFKLNQDITLRSRSEIIWFDKKGITPEEGFLNYLDVLYNPVLKPFAASLRLQYFETGGYNSRLYAYENDVLYSYSIPFFYNKGYRYYINFSYDVNKKLTFWGRWSQTIYGDKTFIGSGLDEIDGNVKSEIKLQALYRF